MIDFIKKVFCFEAFYVLTDFFFTNVTLLRSNQIIKVTFDFTTIFSIIFMFFFGLLVVGIIKLLSQKINTFLYESNKLISIVAFLIRGILWLVPQEKFDWFSQLNGCLLDLSLTIIIALIIYYFWRYHIEICAGVFLSAFIYYHTELTTWFFKELLNISHPNNILQRVFLLTILVLFMVITIYLRTKGIYDFRSKNDKILESYERGPYKRICNKE